MKELPAKIKITDREKFVRNVYASLDEAIADGLDRLRVEEGLQPTCSAGCAHCCRFHIVINLAEARTLAQYIRQEWPPDQIAALKLRTRQWHAWDHSRPGRPGSNPIEKEIDLSQYEDCCPLLVNNRCSVYAVRPIICRTHFVSTPPGSCQAANHPAATGAAPITLAALTAAADPFGQMIRRHLEEAGWDYDRTLMLLPHSLAIAMGWDFGIAL
ncbi:MAG: YkgJ family cysteine cluster protein [Deltaproteobacteria bacterium]|nr:YkgJ family cysteine cluster protein [Deltaproteobacteria bacterium]